MPFELSDEQELIRKTARDLADQVLAGAAEHADRSGKFPSEAAKGLADLGLTGLLAPAEHGGAGLDAVSLAVMVEELARRSGGIAVVALAHNIACRALAASPTGVTHLPKLAAGEEWATLGLAPGPQGVTLLGSDKLTGSARPFPLAGHASIAIVPHPAGGMALLAARAPGARWLPESTLGLRGAELGALVLKATPVERFAADVKPLMDVGLAALAVGLGQASVEESARFAKDRIQFNKPISSFEGVRARLADMALSIDAARAFTWQAAARQDGTPQARRLAGEAKVVATEAASTATRAGIRLHGGAGFLKDFAAERLNRDARMLPLLGGDNASQRDEAARLLLG